jgi:hypothetical protein
MRKWIMAFLPFAISACTDPQDPDSNVSGEELEYEFGAKFEPPVGRIVHALGQWEEYNAKYVANLPSANQPASKLIFVDIGDTPRGWQPASIAQLINTYDQQGVIPHIDVALRGLQPPKAVLDTMSDPLYGIDDEIANTTKYDGRIHDLATIAREYGKPVMMRIGGEFNGWWNGYHPYDFPKAFRKIVTMFRQAGADNVAFIWCYEPAGPDDFDQSSPAGEARWFPGADVIDWFSVDVFASGDVSGSVTQPGRGGLSSYGKVLKFLDMAVANRKPVIIAESAPSHYDFGNAAAAQAAWDEWFAPYFQLIATRSEIKWFHYINYDWTKASYYASSGWKNNDLTASAFLLQRYVAEIGKPKYLHASEKSLLKDTDRFR